MSFENWHTCIQDIRNGNYDSFQSLMEEIEVWALGTLRRYPIQEREELALDFVEEIGWSIRRGVGIDLPSERANVYLGASLKHFLIRRRHCNFERATHEISFSQMSKESDGSDEENILGSAISPEDATIERESIQRINNIVCQLGNTDKMLFQMRWIDEMSEIEMANHFGISYVAIRKRIQRLKAKFKRMLDGDIE